MIEHEIEVEEDNEEIEDVETAPQRAIPLGPKCSKCESNFRAAPIPWSNHQRLCVPCFLRPHRLPFILERLARKEASRASACA